MKMEKIFAATELPGKSVQFAVLIYSVFDTFKRKW
jgi:hypothetical protein